MTTSTLKALNMNNHYCAENSERIRVQIHHEILGNDYYFEVPGERCPVCGDEYISRDVLVAIESLVDDIRRSNRLRYNRG